MDLREEFRSIIITRLVKLEEIKSSIGDTGTNSSQRAIEWIQGLIEINKKFLARLG